MSSTASILRTRSSGYNGQLFQRILSRSYTQARAISHARYPLRPQTHLHTHSQLLICSTYQSARFQSTKSDIKEQPTKSETKDIKKEDEQGDTKALEKLENTPTTALVEETEQPSSSKQKKLTTWEKVKHEAKHYWTGTKLLGYEIKVSTKLIFKMMSGYPLSRRETNQLETTIRDLGRLVPFMMFLIVPFAEFLLPVALKYFPNLLPSTYESKQDREKKRLKLKKSIKGASDYIRTSVEASGLKLSKKISVEEKAAFIQFFHAISIGKNPTKEQLIRVARLFKNDQVLDNLSRHQLVAMCKYMALRPFGTNSILRYQIRHRLLNIIKDDRAIDYEGVDSLTIPELQMACSQRGIKTSDVSPGRLREDLETWLDLRLRQKIPSTLLILSTAFTYGDKDRGADTYYNALLAVLSSIPDEVYNVAKAELAADDSELKLDILKEQNELIEEENQSEKDTVNNVKDDIHLDEYEDTANEGLASEPDSDPDSQKEVKGTQKKEKSEPTAEEKELEESLKSQEKEDPKVQENAEKDESSRVKPDDKNKSASL